MEQGSSLVEHKEYLIQRDTELELILEPGQYIVLPRTTGCSLRRPLQADAEAIKLIDHQGNFHPTFRSTITDIFNKFDLIINHVIEFKEFKGFLDIIGKTIKDENEFKNTILAKYNSFNGALTLKGF